MRSPTSPRTKPNPRNEPPGSAGTGRSRTACTGSVTSPTPRTHPKSAPAPPHRSWPPCGPSPSACTASPEPPTSPRRYAITPTTPPDHSNHSRSLTLPTPWGRYRFREDFEKQLGAVLAVYRDAKVQTSAEGLVLLPSRPHVSPKAASRQLKLPGSSVPLSRPEKGSESGPQVVEQYCVHGGEAGTLPDGAARCPSC